jgi:hypothetical protein
MFDPIVQISLFRKLKPANCATFPVTAKAGSRVPCRDPAVACLRSILITAVICRSIVFSMEAAPHLRSRAGV